ncbi:MAG: Rab family GTPase [Candidatus Jordarchaeum sp.]|uniref:Rab family GTPase n=1 Tax=Candidatus Jordarchaeum sp. TaxID=2823881 RepID=UPI00404B0852
MVDKYIFKILLLGSGGVGKTTLKKRYTEGLVDPIYKTTIGVEFGLIDTKHAEQEVSLHFWDIGGQVQFRDISGAFYKGAKAAVLMFDVTQPKTLNDINEWLKIMKQENVDGIPKIIVGNKIDIRKVDKGHISREKAKEFSDKLGLRYFETSALYGKGTDELLQDLVNLVAKTYLTVSKKVN